MEQQGTTLKAGARGFRQIRSAKRSSSTYVRVGWIAGAFCAAALAGSLALSQGPEPEKTLEWYGIEESPGRTVPAPSSSAELEWAYGGGKRVKQGLVVYERPAKPDPHVVLEREPDQHAQTPPNSQYPATSQPDDTWANPPQQPPPQSPPALAPPEQQAPREQSAGANKYLREAQELLESARKQAMRGNFLRARQLAATASMLPVEWPSPTESAEAFLEELQSFPGFAEALRNPQRPYDAENEQPEPEAGTETQNEHAAAFVEHSPAPAQAEAEPDAHTEGCNAPPSVEEWAAQRENANDAPQFVPATETAAAPTQEAPGAPIPTTTPSRESAAPAQIAKTAEPAQARHEANGKDNSVPRPAAGAIPTKVADSAAPAVQPTGGIEIYRGPVQPAGGIEIYRGSVRQDAADIAGQGRVVTPQPTPSRPNGSAGTKSRSAFYRNEAQTLLERARRRALQGDFLKARQLARSASTLPVDWEPGEDSPQTFLSELESFPGYAEAIRGNPLPVELSAVPGTAKPKSASDASLRIEPLRVGVNPDRNGTRGFADGDGKRSLLNRLSKADIAVQKPSALGRRANDVAALRPSSPSNLAAMDSQTFGGASDDRVRVAAGLLPPAPSRGETLFTNVLINLITIFAALVFGLFALLSAAMLVFRSKLKGGGLNLRVELVTNQPLANLSVTSGPAPAAGAYVAAPPAAQAGHPSADSQQNDGQDDGDDFDPIALAFDPPILSLAEQRKAEEEETRLKEQAILAQILEQNIELRERLQEMEGQPT